ncbi:MAG TPA: SGNH/GDSL hydrolase family protein [Planctomycetota bacterium]|nr:SGNH/GDSL hydrolase family protein [Planctomycetota bacterium]
MKCIALLLLCAPACFLKAEDAKALPLEISPQDEKIVYIGRFDKSDAAGPRANWPGSGMRVKFKGTAINAKLSSTNCDFVQVVVDGEAKSVLEVAKQPTVYTLASGLADKEHVIELFKRTETFFGVLQFCGLQLEAGGKLLPVEKTTRRIEFIGDSITCGYGNEGASQNDKFTAKTENNYMAYGSIAARELKADSVHIAVSGRKLVSKKEDDIAMHVYWQRTIALDPNSKWDTSAWVPDVVLIHLGTNDFGGGNPDEKQWTDAYREFIGTLRKAYPKAHIFVAIGSMMSDNWPKDLQQLSTIRKYCTGVVESLNKSGDKNVHFVEFAPQEMVNGIGSDWHPSVKTHQLMAATLVAAVKKELKW